MKAGDLPRFGEVLNVLKRHSVISKVLVDLGCNDGKLTMEMARLLKPEEIYCIDIDENALNIARSRGLKTYKADLSSDRLPIQDGGADLVTALEVIEHLVNPDNMLREAYRILRNHGYLLITTPNLASWVNRLVMLLGYQPYNCEISTEIVAGVPWKARTFAKPAGHIRPYTLRALREVLTYHGFEIIHVKGAPGVEPRELRIIDAIFSLRPSLARRLIILARKP